MPNTHIPYRSTQYFSDLICDLLDEHPDLQPFYGRRLSLESFKEQMAEKSAAFPASHRKVLTEVLSEDYHKIEVTEGPSVENIQLLAENTAYTITTGHQLNILTGPLYFLYKIISVINLCRQLKQTYPEADFVPVFWMASEDHDIEEISFFNHQGKKYKWSRESEGAVGQMNTQGLDAVFELFFSALGNNNAAKELKAWIKQAYHPSASLAEATRRLVHQLFGDQGLVIIDGDNARLKSLFAPYVKRELTEEIAYQKVTETTSAIQSAYKSTYSPQVNPRKINLFYLSKGHRERIDRNGEEYVLVDQKRTFSKAEILDELEKQPECFSPNALLRPLYQEVILPNLCYIGGGGELAYWLQLRSLFAAHAVPFPILLLRNSAVLVHEKDEKKMQKLNLAPADLFLGKSSLINKKVRQISNIDLDLSSLKDQLEVQFKQLEDLVEQTDASFKGAVAAQKKKQFKGIERLEDRLLRAQKRKLSDHVERLASLHNLLFPNGSLQERTDNFSAYYVAYGEDLIPQIQAALDPMHQAFSWITLK